MDLTGSMGTDGYARTLEVLNGLNVFGDGSNDAIVARNRELLQVVERHVYRFQSRANTVDLLTRGELFQLPAGKIEAAFGAQHREQRYDFPRAIWANSCARRAGASPSTVHRGSAFRC